MPFRGYSSKKSPSARSAGRQSPELPYSLAASLLCIASLRIFAGAGGIGRAGINPSRPIPIAAPHPTSKSRAAEASPGAPMRSPRRSIEKRDPRRVPEDVLDFWHGFVAFRSHLVHYFAGNSDSQPGASYLGAVRKRLGQWILDTASANYDQPWLDYQAEIGRRPHRGAKYKTDGAASADNIAHRYLPALFYPITATLKPFLAKRATGPGTLRICIRLGSSP
jgi:hypothetical protein